MSEIKEITEKLLSFRNERDWKQFHNTKDLAIALNIESSELLELFLWKSAEEAKKENIEQELADIFSYGFLLAAELNLDVYKIIMDKISANTLKYPIDKSKGISKKYTEL